MANESNVTYTGNIDVGSLLGNLASTIPDSPFIKGFFKDIAQPLIDKIKNAKVDGIKLDLQGMFGVADVQADGIKKEVQGATKKLLQLVRKQINKVSGIKLGDTFDLHKLIGNTPKFDILTRERYQVTISKFLNKIQQALKSQNISVENDVSVKDLIGSTPKFDFLTRDRYQITVSKFLNSIALSLKEFKPSLDFGIKDLLGDTPEHSFFTRVKYQKTIRLFFDKIQKALNANFKFSTENYGIKELIGDTPEFSRSTKNKYQNTIKLFLTKVQDAIKNLNITDISLSDIAGIVSGKNTTRPAPAESAADVPKKNSFVSDFDKPSEVIVADFDNKALDKMQTLFQHLGIGQKASRRFDTAKPPKAKGGSFLDSIMEYLGIGGIVGKIATFLDPAVSFFAGIAGIASLFAGLATEGKFKGSLKVIGRLLGGNKLLEKLSWKFIGKFFSKEVLKKIPIIGLLMGIGYGIGRLTAGDWVGGLLEVASGIASVFPIIGTAISVATDIFLAGRDLKTGGSKEIGKKNVKLKNFMSKFWDMFKKVPMIAGLIEVGEALGDMWHGDFIKGLKRIGYGLGDIAFGNILSLFGLDTEKAVEKISTSNFNIGDFTSKIKDWILDSGPFKWLKNMSTQIGKLATGDFSGLEGLVGDMPFLAPILDFMKSSKNFVKGTAGKAWKGLTGMFESTDTNKTDKIKIDPNAKIRDNQPMPEISPSPKVTPLPGNIVSTDSFNDNMNDVSDVFSKGLNGQTKTLKDLSFGINQLLGEFKNASKNLVTIAKNSDAKPQQINNINHSTSKAPIDTNMRDPAYDMRSSVWGKLRNT